MKIRVCLKYFVNDLHFQIQFQCLQLKKLLYAENSIISSVKCGHLGHFDLEPNKHNFPVNPMGSFGTHWARLYNNTYKNQNKN